MSQKTRRDRFQRLQVGILRIQNKTFSIYEGVNTIGRCKEAIVNIKHLNISQNHAVIVIINGNHFISDLNSSNGTFLENGKVEPFKLFELKNNSSIKLGDIYGTYISQGPFSNNDENHFEITQDVTQSFYGSNTQILDNLITSNTDIEIEDIHEAPTQEISWTPFKIPKSVKSDEKNINQSTAQNNLRLPANTEPQEEDIHNCETQVICESPISTKDQSHKLQASNDSKIENEGTGQDAIPKSEIIKDTFQNSSLANVSEDIHDAPTQVLPVLINSSKGVNNHILPGSELFGPFNDEVLPLLENNENYIEIHQIPEVDKTLDIHEAVTQVIDISKKSRSPILNPYVEDDEATDCEDNTDLAGNIKANIECFNEKPTTFQNEASDCEDTTQDNQAKPSSGHENKNNFLESDNDSDDSMEFFKVDRSINKDSKESFNRSDVGNISDKVTKADKNNKLDKISLDLPNVTTENSSDETIRFKKKKVCHLSSDSDTDVEENELTSKNKSSMAIASQDSSARKSLNLKTELNSANPLKCSFDNDKKLSNRDSYVINDTDSETEIESANKVYLEESIAATQNQSPADFNDTDCIPATQEAPIKALVRSPKNASENINGSSEESFKLGLTELMINPEPQNNTNNTSSQDPCCSKTLKNHSPIFGESSFQNNKAVDNIQSDDSAKTDIYIVSTQQNNNREKEDGSKKTTDDTLELYLAPTQKITISEKVDANNEKSLEDVNETDFYDLPTQKIDVKNTKLHIDRDSQLDSTNNDIYIAPTQRIFTAITEHLYEEPTQKIDLKELKYRVDKKNQLDDTDNDIYLAPTQKVFKEVTDTDQNSSREESMDDLYLQPTQQLDDTFNQPTQKVNISNLKIEGNSEDNKFTKPNSIVGFPKNVSSIQKKKKFSFKKKTDLDGSLTNLLNHDPKHTQPPTFLQREDRSSIELEFVENINSPAETTDRPSNPLSHFLENVCELDDTAKPKEKESTTVITDEISIVNKKIVSEDSNNREETKINLVKEESGDVKYKNKAKMDSKLCISLDNVIKEDKAKMVFGESRNDQIIEESNSPMRSLRTKKTSTQSPIGKKLTNKTNTDLSKLMPQISSNKKNENITNKLVVKPIGRRTTRRFSSALSDTKTDNFDLNFDDNKLQVNPDLTDNSLNATSSEINQSVALLESKLSKTRKTMKSAKIQVKVPKSRKSMSISEVDDSLESPENINNNVRSKSDQEKMAKESNTNYDIMKLSISSSSKSNVTTKKRGRPKTRQSAECDIKNKKTSKGVKGFNDSVTIKNNRETLKRNNPKLETLKGKEITVNDQGLEDTSSNSSTSKVVASPSSKTRQVGKRKQLPEIELDISDTSIQSVDLTTPKKQKLQPSRQVGKRKQLPELKSDNSDSSLQSVDSTLVTPKKQKLQPSEALLNTKERGLRKQKPKVVFTMLESPQMESMIKQLGGSVIDSVDACTILLTEHVKRSQKLLSAVGLGKPICSPKWITDSKKAHEFLDPWDYILTDLEAEKKWSFSLKESLNRSRTEKLFNSYSFQIMVTNAVDVLKGAIESCGGKCISRIPPQPLENTFIISLPEQQSKYKKLTKQHSSIKVIEPEAIFDGVLRQELRFSKHYLT